MAAKKAPAKKMAAPAKPKPASAADFRKKEEADKAKAKAKARTDMYGQSGFGQTKTGLQDQADARINRAGLAAMKAMGKSVKGGVILSGQDNPNYVSASIKNLTAAQRKVVEQVMRYEASKPRPKKK